MNAENPSPDTHSDTEAPLEPRRGNGGLALFIGALALALGGWQWFDARQRAEGLEQQIQSRLAEAVAAATRAQESTAPLIARLDALDERLAETERQDAAVRLLQDEIRQSRESIVLLEAEQGLTLAAQQLQLAGNVPVALLALKSADAQLARMDTAEYLPLRKALAADIDRLEKLAPTDVVGLSLRLEKVLGGIDALPLALLARPETVPEAAPASDDRWWAQALLNAWREFKGLVRIQRFDGRDEALIAPGQEFLLRENLKLRLLNARLALFSRNVETFRSELTQADLWLGRHFSTDNPGVASARVTLQALAAAELSLVLPDLAASRKALADLNQARSAR